jgi:Asp-tRNA(Asn)/Glu-tRNA(Gln) amidotransferase A subunit family amidase
MRAAELDRHYDQHRCPIGPLHGVVMTLKDQFDIEGYDSTLGYVGRAFKPAKEDALLVKILKKNGVIFIAKTNLPQSIMWSINLVTCHRELVLNDCVGARRKILFGVLQLIHAIQP